MSEEPIDTYTIWDLLDILFYDGKEYTRQGLKEQAYQEIYNEVVADLRKEINNAREMHTYNNSNIHKYIRLSEGIEKLIKKYEGKE